MYSTFIQGDPAPKGSTHSFAKGKVTHTAKSKAWEAEIRRQLDYVGPVLEGPVAVKLRFWLARPKSVRREHPHVRPDIDKLTRCVLDGLQGCIFKDDGQVISLDVVKTYVTEWAEPGVQVFVEPVD